MTKVYNGYSTGMKEVLYLSFDSLKEGVGASQVLAYMRKVQPMTQVTILSFEKEMPSESEIVELEKDGLTWRPMPFGRYGIVGGLGRVFRLWLRIDRSKIIHARSTLPALAALLRFPNSWIWDCRSLQADQRKALSSGAKTTLSFLVMRALEFLIAKRSTFIIVITNAVVPVFMARYKVPKEKLTVIPTCVDVEKFELNSFMRTGVIKILFAGTFSAAYDVQLINKIIFKLKAHFPVTVTIAASQGATEYWKLVQYDSVVSVAHHEMPTLIREHDLGFSIWRNDLGISLTSVASTKTAEFLACGRPVVINSLQGDFGRLIREHNAGVVTISEADSDIERYAQKIISLIDDEATPLRCRELALKEFNLNLGVSNLIELYKEM
jgi:glycosyltransferase involved in cell wall biosynthesis